MIIKGIGIEFGNYIFEEVSPYLISHLKSAVFPIFRIYTISREAKAR